MSEPKSIQDKIILPGGRKHFFLDNLKMGFRVALPIVVFLIVVGLIINFVVGLIAPFKSLFGLDGVQGQGLINFLAFIIFTMFFFVIGTIFSTRTGKRFFIYFEKEWLNQLPMYSGIRDSIQSFMGAERAPLRQVVSVNVFGNDTRMIGFITDEMDQNFYTVFVPTGPNPANGFIFLVNKEQLEFLDVKPEAAMRMIIGVGMGASVLLNMKKDILQQAEQSSNNT